MQTVGLQVHCGTEGVNQGTGSLKPPVVSQRSGQKGLSPGPAWGGLSTPRKSGCPVGERETTMRTGGEMTQPLQRAPQTAFVSAGHPVGRAGPPTVGGWWLSSGWVSSSAAQGLVWKPARAS